MISLRRVLPSLAVGLSLAFVTACTARAETLQDAWVAAGASDPQIASAAALVDAASDRLAAARGARLPSVTVEAGYTALDSTPAVRAMLPPPIGLSETLPLQQGSYSSYRGFASWPLYTSGQLLASARAADAGLDAARKFDATTRIDVRFAVAQAYVDVLRARAHVAAVRRNRDALASHETDANNLAATGLATRADVLAASVALAEADRIIISSETDASIADESYNRRLSRALDAPVELAELTPKSAVRPPLETLVMRALEGRPEPAAVRADRDRLLAEAEAKRAAGMPQITVTGGYAYQENQYQVHPGLWSIGIGVRWNLWDGEVIRRSASALSASARAASHTLDGTLADIRLQVTTAYSRLRDAERRFSVAIRALELATENVTLAKDRYVAGTGTATEALDAVARLSTADRDALDARYDVVLHEMLLARATGDL